MVKLLFINRTTNYLITKLYSIKVLRSLHLASLSRLCDKLEDWSVERFGQNAKSGRLAFENVLNKLTLKWKKNGIFENNKILQEVKNLLI